MNQIVDEIVKGKKNCAFFITVIGSEYRALFDRVSLPSYRAYCEKYQIGLLILNEYVRPHHVNLHPYNIDPGYQRLLVPSLIKSKFPQYEFLCDVDADCIPSHQGRDIFDQCVLAKGTINLVLPLPSTSTRQQLGKKIALLRKTFQQSNFPLDSLLSGSDEDEKRLLGFDYKGPISTIGTCVSHVDDLARSGSKLYEQISNKFSGYLQNYRNDFYEKHFLVNYLPYEFQAIWNYEVAQHYPFLYFEKNLHLEKLCVGALLSRVDMLHFAGSWPENDVFKDGPFLFGDAGSEFYQLLDRYLNEDTKIKSYGRLKVEQ